MASPEPLISIEHSVVEIFNARKNTKPGTTKKDTMQVEAFQFVNF